jgi:transcriptional regulator with XRE-family HTH domain
MANRKKQSNHPGFGAKIRIARQNNKWTMNDLAEKMEVRKGMVFLWENEKNDISEPNIEKICEILNLEKPWLPPRDESGRRSKLKVCQTCLKEFIQKANTTGKYCSPECWYSSDEFGKLPSQHCEQCKIEFQPGSNTQKFCSAECSANFRKTDNLCRVCGVLIIDFSKHKKYCNDLCKEIAQNSRAKVPMWTKISDELGYVRLKVGNEYTGSHKRGWTYEHRFAMEQYLGRKLLDHENVHHKDGNRANNDISNLELWSKSQPAGQRVEDKLAWAKQILEDYKNEK